LILERLAIGNEKVGLIFERSGDRVAVSTAGLPEAVRVFVRV